MGTFIYFNEEGLSDFVVLEPQWLIDAFKCIITSGRFCRVRPSLRGLWKRLIKEAVLVPELIDEVWGYSKENDFMQHKEKLLLYLSKTGIVSKVSTIDFEAEQQQRTTEQDFFIVPSLLKSHSSTSNVDAFLKSRRGTLTWLVFKFENECVSPTLYHRITAAALGTWSVVKHEGNYLLFENMGVYALENVITHVGVIQVTDDTIEIMVVNLCGNAVNCRESDRFRRFVEMVLKYELDRFHSERKKLYKLYLRCNIGKRGNQIQELDLLERSRYPTVQCPDQKASHKMNVKAMLKEWFPDKEMTKGAQAAGIVDTLQYESGHNFDQEVTEREANQISKAIGRTWEVLGISLGMSRAKIEHIKMDHPHSSRLQIYDMLTTWMRQEADNATLERLFRAMEDSDHEMVDWDLIKNILDKRSIQPRIRLIDTLTGDKVQKPIKGSEILHSNDVGETQCRKTRKRTDFCNQNLKKRRISLSGESSNRNEIRPTRSDKVKELNTEEDKWTWKRCLKERSVDGAKYLIRKGQRPTVSDFKQLSIQQDMPDIQTLVCQDICKYIKSMSECIIDVYAAYRAENTDDIVFIVITNPDTSPPDVKYPSVHRCVGNYSNEGIDVTTHKQSKKIHFTDKESVQLRECLQNHTVNLMNKYSNLTVISACPFKSTKHGSDSHMLRRENCIVLYVRVKGFVPINETKFPERLDGILVDVREGGFKLFGPKQRQDHLNMGCQIGGYVTGTLGAFVDFQNNTCCLTSAHVVLSKAHMSELTFNPDKLMDFPKTSVYQPHTNGQNDCFGEVLRAVYRQGGNKKAGVEVALVAVYKRHPTSGSFPDDRDVRDNQKLAFESGRICSPSQFSTRTTVIKFGSETGLTKGYFEAEDTAIREENYSSISEWKFELHNQIVIESADFTVFATEGDSGALVFVPIDDNYSDLRAFGIFEGKTADGKYLLTPISDVLEALGHPQLAKFQGKSIGEIVKGIVDERINELEQKLQPLIAHFSGNPNK